MRTGDPVELSQTARRAERPRVEGGARRKPFDPIAFVLRRGLLIGVFGVMAGGGLGLVAMQFGKETYETGATLIVDGGTEPTIYGRERDVVPGNLSQFMRTLTTRIRSLDILMQAVERMPMEDWPEFMDRDAHPVKNAIQLFKHLKVSEEGGTYLINLRIAAETRKSLALALNTVMDTYLDQLREEQETRFERRLGYLRAEEARVSERIELEQARVIAMAGEIGNKAFLHKGYDMHYSELEAIQKLYWQARDAWLASKANFEEAKLNYERLRALGMEAYAADRVMDNFGINTIERWTYERLQDMRASIDGMTPENEERRYVDERMASMQEYLKAYKDRVSGETIRILEDTREYELRTALLEAENDFKAKSEHLATLEADMARAQEDAARVSAAIFDAFGPLQLIEQNRERLKALNDRIDDTEMEAKAPIPVSVNEYAGDPTSPASNSGKKLAMLGFVAGFGGVFGVFLAFDFLDNRIRRRIEVEKAIGAPIPAAIPEIRDGVDPARVLLDAPRSVAAVAMRGLAERLLRENERYGGKVFAVGSLSAEAGSTTLCVNIGQALRQSMERVLVLEVHYRRPGLAGMRGSGAGGEVSWYPDGNGMFPQPAFDPERAIFWVGAEEGDPVRLSMRVLDAEILALRESYDAVILDLGTIGEDPVAGHLGARADAVVLVAREDSSLFHHLRVAIDEMVAGEVPAMTAVLNRSTAWPADLPIRFLQNRLSVLSNMHGKVRLGGGGKGRRKLKE